MGGGGGGIQNFHNFADEPDDFKKDVDFTQKLLSKEISLGHSLVYIIQK